MRRGGACWSCCGHAETVAVFELRLSQWPLRWQLWVIHVYHIQLHRWIQSCRGVAMPPIMMPSEEESACVAALRQFHMRFLAACLLWNSSHHPCSCSSDWRHTLELSTRCLEFRRPILHHEHLNERSKEGEQPTIRCSAQEHCSNHWTALVIAPRYRRDSLMAGTRVIQIKPYPALARVWFVLTLFYFIFGYW